MSTHHYRPTYTSRDKIITHHYHQSQGLSFTKEMSKGKHILTTSFLYCTMFLILANIVILLLWLWIVAMILPIFRRQRAIIITSMIGATLGASFLWFSPQLMDGAFSSGWLLAQGVTRSIILILSIISLITHPPQRKPLLQTTIIVAIVAVIGQLLITWIGGDHQGLIQFFFYVVLIEEWIKYAIAQHTHSKRSIHHTDIILMGIFAALSYAWGENILTVTAPQSTITRAPVYLVHTIFTTLFVGGIYHTMQTGSRMSSMITITLALLLHLGYNLLHGQLHRSLWIVTIIIRYGILTHMLSQSDSIYLLHRDTLAKTSAHH